MRTKKLISRIIDATLFAVVAPIVVPFTLPVLYVQAIINKLKGR